MNLQAILTIVFIVLAFAIASITKLNTGIICLVVSFIVATIFKIPISTITGYFPTSTFITMFGVTYLFSVANINGTTKYISNALLRLVKGKRALLPWAFFFIAFILCGIGPGPASTAAMLAGPVLAIASEADIDPFLCSLMSIHGAHCGSLSPLASIGIPVNNAYDKLGYPSIPGHLFAAGIAVNLILGIAVYLVFGGLKLAREDKTTSVEKSFTVPEKIEATGVQKLNIIFIILLIVTVVFLDFNVGYVSMLFGFILNLIGKQEKKAISGVPWGSIVMICGATTMIGLLKASGATELLSDAIVGISSPFLAPLLLIAFPAFGSVYTSASASTVAFAPIAGPLMETIGNPNLIGLLMAMAVSALLTTASPLSLSGAMYAANVQNADKDKFYKKLLYYGLSMIIIGSIICWLLFVVILKF